MSRKTIWRVITCVVLTLAVQKSLAQSEQPVAPPYNVTPAQIEEYRMAMKQGNIHARYLLGYLQIFGMGGVKRDVATGIQLWKSAAELGNTTAASMLGQAFSSPSYGLAKNNAEAAYWYGLAAKQGHVDAQVGLGLLYLNGAMPGRGKGADLDIAEAWFKKAAARGNRVAIDNLEFIPRHRRVLEGKTSADTAALFALLIAALAAEDRDYERRNAAMSLSSSDPEIAQCLSAANARVVECYTYRPPECQTIFCDTAVSCRGRGPFLGCDMLTYGPYGQDGDFYCDPKNTDNLEFSRDLVVRNACNGKFE